MKNLPIISKFMVIMGIFGLFALSTAVYSTHQMRHIDNNYTALMASYGQAEVALSGANRNLSNIRAGIGEVILGTNDEQDAQAKAFLFDSLATVKQLAEQAAHEAPGEAAQIEALEANVNDLVNTTCAKTISDGMSANTAAEQALISPEYFDVCAPAIVTVSKSLMGEVRHMMDLTNTEDDALTGVTNHTILITYSAIIIGTFLVMLLGFFAIRAWLVSPIKLLQSVMGRLARNDLSATVPGLERRDEIGGMANAVQVFKDNGLEKVKLEENLKIAAEQTEKERKAAAEVQAQAAARLKFVVESLAEGLAKLADGDLLYRLNDSFAAEYDKLRGDFNAAVSRLEETMMKIADNTQAVHNGAGEITQASDDLARRTEQQAASLEQTAAALDQITTTVRKTADSAGKAHHVADTARSEAERSNTVVTETVNAMSAIETSSGQIANIIGVIDEIAFQTNLLALNAGIEAARAGDAGRGFAVVATEVRALAQRSAEAAKEIKTLISASSEQVGSGVKFVGETGKALTRIIGHVSELNHLVGEIAASAKEQATGLAEVNTAVNQMDQVTQQNAAMVEQATAASHSLVNEATALASLVGRFRTTNARGSAPPSASPRRSPRLELVGPGE